MIGEFGNIFFIFEFLITLISTETESVMFMSMSLDDSEYFFLISDNSEFTIN